MIRFVLTPALGLRAVVEEAVPGRRSPWRGGRGADSLRRAVWKPRLLCARKRWRTRFSASSLLLRDAELSTENVIGRRRGDRGRGALRGPADAPQHRTARSTTTMPTTAGPPCSTRARPQASAPPASARSTTARSRARSAAGCPGPPTTSLLDPRRVAHHRILRLLEHGVCLPRCPGAEHPGQPRRRGQGPRLTGRCQRRADPAHRHPRHQV
mmetsp:Transcript_11144/g.33418  ORF Transcript_11144/g.33418 Transcript_11144/m.33418 type:complete len:212 (+) Transcript_11144:1737-2372(+)